MDCTNVLHRHSWGRRVDPTAEEDSYDDVLCVLELLSHLVTKDLVDQSEEEPGSKVMERHESKWCSTVMIVL